MSLRQKKHEQLILYLSDCHERGETEVLSNKIITDCDIPKEILDEITGPLKGKFLNIITEQGQTYFYIEDEIVEKAREIRASEE